MSRLVYPSDFAGQKTLTDNIISKDATDGATSVLNPFAKQNNFTMAQLQVAGVKASQFDAQSKLLHKQSENYSQQRDLLFDPLFETIKSSTQFLKSFYRKQVQELGEWGITVDARGRIAWPADFAARQALVLVFLEKHAGYPAGQSPLLPYLAQHSIDPDALAVNAENALTKHKVFAQATKDAEEATQNRNNTWAPAWAQVQGIGNYLMKLFAGGQKKLGEWGFNVDDSPKAAKLRTTKLKLGEIRTVNGVLIGSTMQNVGDATLHIYRGRTTAGTPTILEKGETLGVQKGWSTITIVNPDALKSGKLEMMITGS